jgi:hypothetical protein
MRATSSILGKRQARIRLSVQIASISGKHIGCLKTAGEPIGEKPAFVKSSSKLKMLTPHPWMNWTACLQ